MDNLKFINLEPSIPTANSDANLVWKNCLTHIKENVTLMTYNTWFLPIRPVSIKDNNLKVQLPNQFFWEWIDEHFSTIVKKTIFDVLGENGKLSYIIADEKEQNEELVRQNSLIEVEKINVVDNNGDNICDVLPVELISFNATRLEKDGVLEWETATELNNDFFTRTVYFRASRGFSSV